MIDNGFLIGWSWVLSRFYLRLTKLLKALGMIDNTFHTSVKLLTCYLLTLSILCFESKESNFVHLMPKVRSVTNLALSPRTRNENVCNFFIFVSSWFVSIMKFVNHREFREHVKDLSCLSKDLCRVVLVDNNLFSFVLQPLNGLPCISFSAEHPYDEQVMRLFIALKQIILDSLLYYYPILFGNFLVWYSYVALGGHSSSPPAPFSTEGCEACTLWKVQHAWVVSNARNPCLQPDCVRWRLQIMSSEFRMFFL